MNPAITGGLIQWPPLVSALMICGSGAAIILIGGRGRYSECAEDAGYARFSARIDRLWTILAMIALIGAPIAMLADVARMAAVPIGAAVPLVGEVVRLTHAGRLWLSRIGFVTLTAVVAIAIPRGVRIKPAALFCLAAGTLSATCIAGHAIDRGNFAVAVCIAHLLAAALWIGSLVTLLCAAGGTSAIDSLIARMAPRVSQIAGWSVAALIGTGGYMAWLALGATPASLIYSSWGRTLLVKIAVFLAIVITGGYNRYRLVPAVAAGQARSTLIRNVGIECALLGGVIALAAVLANTPPPH